MYLYLRVRACVCGNGNTFNLFPQIYWIHGVISVRFHNYTVILCVVHCQWICLLLAAGTALALAVIMFHLFCKISRRSSRLKYASAPAQVQALTNLTVRDVIGLQAWKPALVRGGPQVLTAIYRVVKPALWYQSCCLTIVRVSQPWISRVSQEQFILLGETGPNCRPWEGNTATASTLLHLTATANIIDFCFPPSSAFKTRLIVYWLQRTPIATFLKAHKTGRAESLQPP